MSEWIMSAEDIDDITSGLFIIGKKLVRCGECKWWKCADDTEIIRYGDCTHPYSAVRKNCLPNETWYCADGERKEQTDE